MDIRFHIPGTKEPEITVRRRGLGSPTVLLGGVAAKRLEPGPSRYEIPLPDGSIRELQLKGQWTGLKAVVDGVETPLEPPLGRVFHLLTFAPLVIGVLVTGLIGGAIGTAINVWLARRSMGVPLKLSAMLGVTVLATAGSFAIGFSFGPLPKLETGACVMGIRGATEVTTRNSRPADCAKPHDGEVVGVARYPAEGSFPGDDAMKSFAPERCDAAFETYVGVDFQASVLEMLLVVPSSQSWGMGDREIACVVLAAGGGQLTGSVKGTAR